MNTFFMQTRLGIGILLALLLSILLVGVTIVRNTSEAVEVVEKSGETLQTQLAMSESESVYV